MTLAKQIISDMGCDWESTESPVRRVAEHCAKTMYSEEEVYTLLEQPMKDCYTDELQNHWSGDFKNLKDWFGQLKKKQL